MKNLEHFKEIIHREPSYSYGRFLEIPSDDNELDDFIQNLLKDDFFTEAIYLASPELYYGWKDLKVNYVKGDKKRLKLNRSILKYYIRIATRCTPFGLFSNYCNYLLDNEEINSKEGNLTKYISVDLLFLYALVGKLNEDLQVRKHLKFSINNSLYKIGQNYRYLEVIYKDTSRFHRLASLKSDEVIELLFSVLTEESKPYDFLIELLLNSIENVSRDEVEVYLNDLIHSQVLTSNLDIALNTRSPLKQIIKILEGKLSSSISKKGWLNITYESLVKLDKKCESIGKSKFENSIDKYEEIFKIADNIGITYQKQYLINVNLRKKKISKNNSLNNQDVNKIKKAINILSHFSTISESRESKLENFKKKFLEKYEDEEVPLLVALDPEVGIDYRGFNEHQTAISDLIDDLKWDVQDEEFQELKYNVKIHNFWNKIFHQAYSKSTSIIDLSKEDLSDFESTVSKLPRTFGAMVNKIGKKIVIQSIGGNALNWIGRFTNLDENLNNLTREIVKSQETQSPDWIHAELIHLPNNRVANILTRNIPRNFEIPFLSASSNGREIISMNDIGISLKYGNFRLRSISRNKFVKVYNSNAHYYASGTLPVYQFLCDLQYDSKIRGFGVNIGSVNQKAFKFFPRIVYGEDIVLSSATWRLNYEDLHLGTTSKNDTTKYALFKKVKNNYKIPRFVYLVNGDNKLLIDSENEVLIEYIYEYIKKNKEVLLMESIENIESSAKNFANEFIVSFKNNLHEDILNMDVFDSSKEVTREFISGKEWIYFKIYTGIKSADILIAEVIKPLVNLLKEENLIFNWFFIRYNDPDFHLRVRFRFNDKIDGVIHRIHTHFIHFFKPFLKENIVYKVQEDTYKRELERYGWALIEEAEQVFSYDSDMAISLISLNRTTQNDSKIWLLTMKAIDGYFDVFNISISNRLQIMERLQNSFLIEFGADKNIRKQIGIKFRNYEKEIFEIMSNDDTKHSLIIAYRNQMISKNLAKTYEIGDKKLNYLIPSFIHMTVNRIISANPRMHELVLYSLLQKYYKIKDYQFKSNSVKVQLEVEQ